MLGGTKYGVPWHPDLDYSNPLYVEDIDTGLYGYYYIIGKFKDDVVLEEVKVEEIVGYKPERFKEDLSRYRRIKNNGWYVEIREEYEDGSYKMKISNKLYFRWGGNREGYKREFLQGKLVYIIPDKEKVVAVFYNVKEFLILDDVLKEYKIVNYKGEEIKL